MLPTCPAGTRPFRRGWTDGHLQSWAGRAWEAWHCSVAWGAVSRAGRGQASLPQTPLWPLLEERESCPGTKGRSGRPEPPPEHPASSSLVGHPFYLLCVFGEGSSFNFALQLFGGRWRLL